MLSLHRPPYRCEACAFSFERFGEECGEYIQVPHLRPLATKAQAHTPRASDFALLCANCSITGSGRHSARSVLERAVAALGVPAVSGAAFGHGRRNLALPIGVQASLDAQARTLTLLEPAVR